MKIEEVLQEAASNAGLSPCVKSKRGVVIFDQKTVYGYGYNHPPKGFTCDGSEECRANCGKICVHAEQDALIKAGAYCSELEMLHVKLDEQGYAVAGGPPSCPDCSKLILDAGIKTMWLYELRDGEPTLVPYTAKDFHLETLKNCGLHIGQINERKE